MTMTHQGLGTSKRNTPEGFRPIADYGLLGGLQLRRAR